MEQTDVNKAAASMNLNKKPPLPIGVSDFKNLVSSYYYVDKTLLIKDFLDTRAKVTLFTRPRRFGKTLNMDMLKTFFEISEEDTSVYFKGMNIWACGEEYRREQGQYPVIFASFKDVKARTWANTLEGIRDVIAQEYRRHKYLLEDSQFDEYEKRYFYSILDGTVTEVGLAAAFRNLSTMLNLHYGQPAIIIVDEYDTPIQQGYMAGYYNDVVGFMRNLFSGAFKDNSNLAYGFLTGILRVAKESIFSGLNNLKLNSILEKRYSEYFGFTKEEIGSLMKYYGRDDKYEEICEWYDGYRFGNTDIFNPWSVLNYLDENCFPKAFWQFTGDNSIIRQIVAEADEETSENLRRLMQGKTVSSYIDTSVIYPEIRNNPSTIYSFLLAAGYLKTVRRDDCHDGNAICDVAIPNKEIFYVYE
ncbi:MAG: AAA family ATPase, partial [Lachnospiraceae bacterium]|nr:AAA family ATPase [Lachnospiraceae bacterium]